MVWFDDKPVTMFPHSINQFSMLCHAYIYLGFIFDSSAVSVHT